MMSKLPLYILFTMGCEPPEAKPAPEQPKTWEFSARSIEGFCNRVLNCGYAPTLFVSARCADEHAPLLEELAGRGVELGLHLHPPSLGEGGYKGYLGDYGEDQQRELIEVAVEQFYDALGVRPRSFRSGRFSATDATFRVLYDLGFRQGSLSSPGRSVRRHAASWQGALADPHYVDPENRLLAGTLPFLELPVTSDATRQHGGGLSYELGLEFGSVEDWHQPIVEGQLQRMADQHVAFRTLCLYTHNSLPYHLPDDRHAVTLEALFDYLDTLRDHYEVVATTASGAHEHWRRSMTALS